MRILTFVLCAWCGLAFAEGDWHRAVTLYDDGKLDAAQSVFEGLKSADPANAETYYYLGLIQQSRGNFLLAADQFEKAIELDDSQSKYHLGYGEAYGSASADASFFKQMRMAGKIKSAFQRAVELDTDNIRGRFGLITYYLNAPGIAGGSEDKAEEQAREIGKRDVFQGHLAMARIHEAREDEAAVEREYAAAIADSPDEMDAYLALGIFLTAKERFGEAMKVYEAALERKTGDMGITYQVGRTASISGHDLDRGETAFKRYLEYTPKPDEPGLDWANYRLGLIYQHQNKNAQAAKHYQQAVSLNKDHPHAKKALRKVSR